MKIIATTATGFLVAADKQELANICGYYSDYAMPESGRCLAPNFEINVNGRYRALGELCQQERKVIEAQATMRAAAEALNLCLPIVRDVALELNQHEVK